MISIQQREYAAGYLDAMTPNELLDQGEKLFRQRRIETITTKSSRRLVKMFDGRAGDAESQASDRRADLVKRRVEAEMRLLEAEIAIKNFILAAAEIIKTERGDTTRQDLIDITWQILYSDVDNHIPNALHQRARAVLAEAEAGK